MIAKPGMAIASMTFCDILLRKKTACVMQIRTMSVDVIFHDNLKIFGCDKIAASLNYFYEYRFFTNFETKVC